MNWVGAQFEYIDLDHFTAIAKIAFKLPLHIYSII